MGEGWLMVQAMPPYIGLFGTKRLLVIWASWKHDQGRAFVRVRPKICRFYVAKLAIGYITFIHCTSQSNVHTPCQGWLIAISRHLVCCILALIRCFTLLDANKFILVEWESRRSNFWMNVRCRSWARITHQEGAWVDGLPHKEWCLCKGQEQRLGVRWMCGCRSGPCFAYCDAPTPLPPAERWACCMVLILTAMVGQRRCGGWNSYRD